MTWCEALEVIRELSRQTMIAESKPHTFHSVMEGCLLLQLQRYLGCFWGKCNNSGTLFNMWGSSLNHAFLKNILRQAAVLLSRCPLKFWGELPHSLGVLCFPDFPNRCPFYQVINLAFTLHLKYTACCLYNQHVYQFLHSSFIWPFNYGNIVKI